MPEPGAAPCHPMTDFRRVTDQLSVSPQITAAEVAEAASMEMAEELCASFEKKLGRAVPGDNFAGGAGGGPAF